MQIIFTFEDGTESVIAEANAGQTILEAAKDHNIAVDAPCGGNGACGKCRVKVISGEVSGGGSSYISEDEFSQGWRLACGARLVSDAEIMIPDIALAYRSRMKTADLSSGAEVKTFLELQNGLKESGIDFENSFEVYDLVMSEPSLDDTLPDTERITNALKEASGYEDVFLSYHAVKQLAHVLRESAFHVKAVAEKCYTKLKVYSILPADDELPVCGLAIDIGTTTVSAVITDIKTGKLLAKGSGGNGQIRYGADVINRIVEQSKEGGIGRLQDAVIDDTLTPLIRSLCSQAKIPKDRIVRACVASNTTMNHLLLGVDAEPVRMEPYIPTFFHWKDLHAGELGLPVHPDARVLLAPNIGSYVGGDITAGTLATRMWDKDEFSLFIDLGTNGEIVFGNRDFLMSCACSAGPAFEGGDISCGMRATDGAVEAVKIDVHTLEPDLTIIGDDGQKPVGICGSGIIDIIAELYRTSAISSKGHFTRENRRILADEHGMQRYVLAFPEESDTGREISITEVDIDSFMRAKGAIFSAIHIMLATLDMPVEVLEHIYVAGGIGSGIDMENAVRIGMLPDIDRSLFEYIGNSSLAGAYAMVISDMAEEKTHEIASNMTYMELSTNPHYMDEFVAACFLPHTDISLFPSAVQEQY